MSTHRAGCGGPKRLLSLSPVGMSYSVRRFHKMMSYTELKSVTLLEMKKYLRFKTVDFKESFAWKVK